MSHDLKVNSESSTAITIIAIIVPVVFLLILAFTIILVRKLKKKYQDTEVTDENYEGIDMSSKTIIQIKQDARNSIAPSPKLTKANTPFQQDITNVLIQNKIGEGNFAEVYSGLWNHTLVALKKLKSEEYIKQFITETKFLVYVISRIFLEFSFIYNIMKDTSAP